mgnify:CR=1 FL=1
MSKDQTKVDVLKVSLSHSDALYSPADLKAGLQSSQPTMQSSPNTTPRILFNGATKPSYEQRILSEDLDQRTMYFTRDNKKND